MSMQVKHILFCIVLIVCVSLGFGVDNAQAHWIQTHESMTKDAVVT
jgi:hypothetical protein